MTTIGRKKASAQSPSIETTSTRAKAKPFASAEKEFKAMLKQSIKFGDRYALEHHQLEGWATKNFGPIEKMTKEQASFAYDMVKSAIPKLAGYHQIAENLAMKLSMQATNPNRPAGWTGPAPARQESVPSGPARETRRSADEAPVRYEAGPVGEYGAKGSKGWSSSWNGGAGSVWTGKR